MKELEIKNQQGIVVACRQSPADTSAGTDEKMTFDAATKVWRGRECLCIKDLIEEGIWPTDGKQSLDGKQVGWALPGSPRPAVSSRVFIFPTYGLMKRLFNELLTIRPKPTRPLYAVAWMPAWIDSVEYAKFGRATVTATLFGGMDESLIADFKKDATAYMNASENTLKQCWRELRPCPYGFQRHDTGSYQDKRKSSLGSSGIQIRFETDLIIEGIRPGRVVRIRPASWPQVDVPREEFLGDNNSTHEDRFPTPAIFPKY